MKLFEKILLNLAILLFVFSLTPYSSEIESIFEIFIILVSISYMVGGYWMFNKNHNKNKFIPITAGIVFGMSLFFLNAFTTLFPNRNFIPFTLPNVFFFIILSIYYFRNRNSEKIIKKIQGIYLRSFSIVLFVGFFAYLPHTSLPRLYAVYTLNWHDEEKTANTKTGIYLAYMMDELRDDNCEKAIEYGKKSLESGNKWINLQPILNFPEEAYTSRNIDRDSIYRKKLVNISDAYSGLYQAYICKGNEYQTNNNISKEIESYLIGDSILNCTEHHYELWEIEKAYSSNRIGRSYQSIKNYTLADSFLLDAVQKYVQIKDASDAILANFITDLAISAAEQNDFSSSNLLYNQAISILKKDTTNPEDKISLILNLSYIVKNHLQADSLNQAKIYIKEALNLVERDKKEYCYINLYNGVYLYRIDKYSQSKAILKECLDCFNKFLEPSNQTIAENHLVLAYVNIALAEYNKAKRNLNIGIEITETNFGINSVRYANHIRVLAHLNKIEGSYRTSLKGYINSIDIYSNELGDKNEYLPEVLSGLSELEITLSKFRDAKIHSDHSLAIASIFSELFIPGNNDLLNQSAHVHYNLGILGKSDSLYNKVIEINNNYGLQKSASNAIALNGLGLINSAIKEFKIADSLFIQSLDLHKEIFTENNPLTAMVYLNYSHLRIGEKRSKEAHQMLAKSMRINKTFFEPNHDIFGDIYFAYGDLALIEKMKETAREQYQKALDIYLNKFNEEHVKVIITRAKLRTINS